MKGSCALWLSGLLIACGRTELITYSELAASDEAGDAAGSAASSANAGEAGSAAMEPAGAVDDAQGTRWILSDNVRNARDLGGVALESGKRVAYGMVFRGPPLANLSSSGCAAISELPIRTVIDLRTEEEVIGRPEDACVGEAATIVYAPLPVPYDVSPAAYLRDLGTTDSIATVFRTLGDPAAYPVYFHCTYGRDRTGVVAALILRALGASRDDVMSEYLLSLMSVGAYPDSLTAVLDEIDQSGGASKLLEASGVSMQDIATLRKQAIEHAPKP